MHWKKGTLPYRVQFLTGKITKDKKGETQLAMNLIKPFLRDTTPSMCREWITMRISSQTVQSVRQRKCQCQVFLSPDKIYWLSWADSLQQQKPRAHRQTKQQQWSHDKGRKKNQGKKTSKSQTALRHNTVSALPTTSTTHAPTKLVLPPKLTCSAYPLPQSFKFSFLTEKKLHGKNPVEGKAKCIMIAS